MGVLLYINFFCIVLNLGVRSNDLIQPDAKIVGGFDADITQFPYAVFILLQQGSLILPCGGSIISNRFILTAAHCLQHTDSVTLRVGSTDAHSGGTVYNSSTIIIHPLFNFSKMDYDIGLIQISQDIILDGVTTKTISLPANNAPVIPGTTMVLSGWGTTSEIGAISPTLMAVNIPIISNPECSTVLVFNNVTITSRMFCAGVVPQGGKDSCLGDSGSPAVLSGVQIGLVSFRVVGCARPNKPGVYTRIAEPRIRSWIKTVTGV